MKLIGRFNRFISFYSIFIADNGSLFFWDWLTGYNFQRIQSAAQSGSIDSEAGILGMTFDQSGSRLLTVEADKTIKIYKEDEEAVSSQAGISFHLISTSPSKLFFV